MKILFVNYTMNIGGIESFILNISNELKKQGNEIGILCYRKEKFILEEEITKNGYKLYKIDNPDIISAFKHFKQLINFFKNNKYDVVHCNTYTDSGYVMIAAFIACVKVRVTHSHTSQQPKSFKQKLKWLFAKILIELFSNRKIACSKVAGDSLYLSKKYDILENGVDVTKYEFNKEIRKKIRKELNINDKEIVIGHVGRFVPLKNHKFIINIFKDLDKNYKLVLIGDGPELNNIKEMVKELKLEDRVIFTGNIKNTNEYLNALDLVLFPSFYEGLPVSLIEQQMNGLQIISSNNVSNEVNLFGNVHFFDLEDKETVFKLIKEIGNKRIINNDYFKDSNYNIENTCKKLLDIYNK